MFKKLLCSFICSALLAVGVWGISGYEGILFQTVPWVLIGAAVAGTTLGTTRAIFAARRGTAHFNIERHTVDSFLEHWGTGAGIFMLLYSGYQMRAGPGLFVTNLHFLAVFVTLFFGCQFLADFIVSKKHQVLLPDVEDIVRGTIGKYFLRTEWSDYGKYLSSQKAAFLAFAIIGSEVIITGAVKLAATFLSIPPEIVRISTSIHDIVGVLFVLMLIVHILLVVLVRSHRPLLRSWLTGA